MRKYRVLHVIDSFDLGGAQEALVNLIEFGDRTRFDFEVACLHGPGVYSAAFARLGIPVHTLSPHKFLPLYIPALLRLFIGKKFDIVHCHLIASNLIAKPLAALCGIQLRFNHDQTNDVYRYRDKIRLRLDMLANRLSTHIFAVSSSIREFLLLQEDVEPGCVSLLHNAIDLRRFDLAKGGRASARKQWDLPPDKIIVGGIGRLNFQKNFSLFLEIAARVLRQHSAAFFVIAGSGPEEKRLKEQARSLGIEEQVRFLGYVEKTESLYPALDYLLMPSRFEGLPMTLLEAMAMNVPVVASRLDGIAEILKDGTDGLLIAPGDRDAFVIALLRLFADASRGRMLAAAARKKVTSTFSAGNMARRVEERYLRHLS